MFRIATPVIYLLLAALWLFIFWFCLRRLTFWRRWNKTYLLALSVLAVDAFRTLFENLYFGTWYSAKMGILPASLDELLVLPQNAFVPKAFNLLAGIFIIMIVAYRWQPEEEVSRPSAGSERERELEEEVADRKVIENALRQSEERFRSLVQNSPDLILEVDYQGVILFAGNQIEGMGNKVAAGQLLFDLIRREYHNVTRDALETIFFMQKRVEYECRGISRDDDELWLKISLGAINTRGEVVTATVIVSDISKQYKSSAILKQNEERLESLLNLYKLRDLSEDKIVRFALEEIVKLTGSKAGYLHFVHPDQESINLYCWSEAVMQECTAEKVEHYPVASAGLWADCIRLRQAVIHNDYMNSPERRELPPGHIGITRHMSVPVFENDRVVAVVGLGNREAPYGRSDVKQVELYVGGLWEILQRKRTEEELERARRESDAATAAKSEFLANMSHEIRTPINAIVGLTYLALDTELTTRQFDYLAKIRSSSRSLLGVINDILDFSKIEAGKLAIEAVDFNLNTVLKDVSNIMALKAEEKDVELIFTCGPDVLYGLRGDPLRLGQVLINLIGNAIKFTERGEIVVGTERVEHGPEQVRLRFSVKDSGIGMTKEQVANLFQSFSQADSSTSRKFGGTGLGLSISKRLVEMMNGTIEVTSEFGRGSLFSFTVQLARAAVEIPRKEQMLPAELSKLRVLVVDDNKTIREILQDMLTPYVKEVLLASSGEEALELLGREAECEERLDLLLMDWKMPGMNGLETIRSVKNDARFSPYPKIIMITAYSGEEIIQQARTIGVQDFLVKPLTPSTLLDAIMGVFGKAAVKKRMSRENSPVGRGIGGGLRGLSVLLAEDNEINQQVASELLAKIGIQVDIANNGFEVLSAVGKKKYDLILMDIQMPEMDGMEAAARIRDMEAGVRDVPIIAMTAHAMKDDRQKCLQAGMNDHITKPVEPGVLYTTLKKWIQGLPESEPSGRNGTEDETKVQTGGREVLPDRIAGLDIRLGLERVAGNSKVYANLLIKFSENEKEVGRDIRAAFEQGDRDRCRELVHSLRGVAGNIGAERLQQGATELETVIREQGDAGSIISGITELEEEMSTLVSAIEEWRHAYPLAGDSKAHVETGSAFAAVTGPRDRESLHLQCLDLLELLAANDTQALSLFEAMQFEPGVAILPEEEFARLEKKITSYDFLGAHRLLGEVIKTLATR